MRPRSNKRPSRRVSRATAYRYFPTKEVLLIELQEEVNQPVEALIANLTTDDVEERLLALIDTFDANVVAEEEFYRSFTRVSLDTWLRARRTGEQAPVVREGRRMRWLDSVLAPMDGLPPERKRLLQAALALTLGGEAIITMKDVCRLDDDDTLVVLRWAATALPRAGLQEVARPAPGDRPVRARRNGRTAR